MAASKRLRGDPLLLDEYVDERLHGLHFFIRDELVVFGNGNKMDKAHVEDVMLVNVPERIEPMSMVKMRIATEHLFHDALAVLVESLVETTRLANPFLGRGVYVGIWRCRRSDLTYSKGFRHSIHFVCREHDWVMDLANNPFLDTVDELGSRNFGGAAIHEPSVSQSRKALADRSVTDISRTFSLPSSGHGWAGGFIAERKTCDTIDLLNDLQHPMKQAVLFDN